MSELDVDALRAEFPALRRQLDGRAVVFLDGPGGTQVPQRVIDAVAGYLTDTNANAGGAFATSEASDAMVDEAHAAVADFLGAGSPEEIKFGYNMSTLTLHIGRSIGATLGPTDEIVVTTLDHEANVSTWEAMAAERGVTVRKVDIREDDVTLDLEDLESKLNPRTKVVAVGYASNAVGTINPVREIVARAHEVGALTYVDAVAFAPHGPIDVRALDTDFLVCSAYKWFGPHLGALYGKAEVLDSLPAFKVRPAHDRFETGTAAFESIAGTLAATDYLRDIGRRHGGADGADSTGRARGGHDRDRGLRAGPRDAPHRWPRGHPRRDDPRHHRADAVRRACPDRLGVHRRCPPAERRGDPRSARDLRLGRRFLRDRSHRATRQGRWRRPAPRAGPLQHRRGGRPGARGGRVDRLGGRRVTRPESIQARLARPFDPTELRRIKRLWVRHSIAEERRDIEGLIATLSPDCVYEIAVTGQRWVGHDGARSFYAGLFEAFPDNAFALSEIVIGPQGVFEVATLSGTNRGPWAGLPPSGMAVSLEVVILFPWDPLSGQFRGERIWFDRESVSGDRP